MNVGRVHSFILTLVQYTGCTHSVSKLHMRSAILQSQIMFSWVLVGTGMGGSVFINHYTFIFLVLAVWEVQRVLKWSLCEFMGNFTGKFRIHQKHYLHAAPKWGG